VIDPNDPLPIEHLLCDEDLRAVGCLAAETTRLEACIDELLADLCSLNRLRFDALLSGKMIGAKADILFSLLEPYAKSTKRKAKLKALQSRTKTAISDRNTVIHGQWIFQGIDWKTGKLIHAATKGKGRTVTADRVMNVAREAVVCLVELIAMYRLISPLKRRPSRKKSVRLSQGPS
jgi:hypothetical protein